MLLKVIYILFVVYNYNLIPEPETGIEYILDQIKHDKSCTFPDLEINWKATTNYRLNEIQKASTTTDILNKWSRYTLPLGYRLANNYFNFINKF